MKVCRSVEFIAADLFCITKKICVYCFFAVHMLKYTMYVQMKKQRAARR